MKKEPTKIKITKRYDYFYQDPLKAGRDSYYNNTYILTASGIKVYFANK